METNLNKVKEIAKLFLHLPIQYDKVISPLLHVYHPFISSCALYTGTEFIDIIANPEKLNDYIKYMEEQINDGDLVKIYMLVKKAYRLTFIKHCESYLSEKDLAEYFADAWVSSENPNQDANCSIHYLTSMFKKCNKKYLMTEKDYKVYESLPDVFPIYRGVAVGRNPNGLSWTQNQKTAQWFAHRFDRGSKKGYVQKAIAKKEDVLAYFNTRGEDEIVYNRKKLQVSILEEE